MDWIDLAQGRDRRRALANADCDAVNITQTRKPLCLITRRISWT